METKVVNLVIKTGDANAAIKKTDKSVKGLKKTTSDAGKTASKNFGGLNNALGAMPASIQKIIGGLQSFKVALISTGVGAFVVAAGALVSLFVSATKKGSEFAKSLSTLRAVSGATKEEMDALSRSAKELGSTTQFTAIEVAQLQTEYAKLGKTTPEILAATEATLDLAASLEVGLADAATLAGSVVNSFGLQASDTQRVVDVLAKSTSSSSLDFGLLTESLKMAAPIARATGKTIEETAGLLGVLADNGVKGSIAGTGLSKVMSELNKKGLTFEQAYQKVNESTDKLGTAQELVGEIGAKSLLNLANSEKAINKLTDSLEASEGAAKRMAEIRLDNLEGDTTKLSSAWEGFLLSLEDGDGIFSKFARKFVQGLTKIISKVTRLGQIYSAVFTEINATAEVQIMTLRTSVSEFFANVSKVALRFKEAIADVPFVGKAIDKNKLAKDRKAITDELNKLGEQAEYWSNLEKKRAEEGSFIVRAAKRLAAADEKKLNEEIAESNKIKSEENIKELKEEEKATRDLIKLKEEELKKIQAVEAKTEEELIVKNKKIAVINQEIKRLKSLGIEVEKVAKVKEVDDQKELDRKEKQWQELQRIRNTAEEQELLELAMQYDKKLELALGNDILTEELMAEHLLRIEAIEEGYRQKKKDADDKSREDERQADLKAANDGLQLAADGLNSIQSLGNAVFAHKMKNLEKGSREEEKVARKAFKFNKALQLGMAVIDGGKAITASLAQAPVAIGAVPNPAGIASLAFASITSAAQIAMIAAQKYQPSKTSASGSSSTTPSTSGGGTSPSQPPSFNVVGQSQANQVSMALANQQPAQAYVVAGNVTTAQQLQNNTIQQATF